MPTGMPIMWALANPKIGEPDVLAAMLEVDTELVSRREGILLMSDKGFASKAFEKDLAELGVTLLRPSLKREKKRYACRIGGARGTGPRPAQPHAPSRCSRRSAS
ncbi:hypothetical protein ACIG0C_21410 [Kitasatospora aureofaciens]|uniref:Transposase IS4-like domain-containing protein n=1 Tax=Kitasatospora aureofaciens TaxID=1894 RepID=A0A1E7N251_KITAU|nr:hypothetical protein [Kitasatospora aureofaciens]OEV34755.1 hypothetical protein HS99_0009745 [Kitasatospora aureofaciens]GGU92196.1 hypothetical protein GCM10010502_51960 [Kitasatospora aureofaciens]